MPGYAPTGTGPGAVVCVCVRGVCPALGPGGPEEFFTRLWHGQRGYCVRLLSQVRAHGAVYGAATLRPLWGRPTRTNRASGATGGAPLCICAIDGAVDGTQWASNGTWGAMGEHRCWASPLVYGHWLSSPYTGAMEGCKGLEPPSLPNSNVSSTSGESVASSVSAASEHREGAALILLSYISTFYLSTTSNTKHLQATREVMRSSPQGG